MASLGSFKWSIRLASCALATLEVLTGSPETAQAQEVQGCQPNQFVDRSAPSAQRTLTWEFGIQDGPERCIQVRVGQTVTWNGNLDDHPLAAEGGDTPNPILFHQNGSVTFTAPGTFGYVCLAHSPMVGSVKVVPAAPQAVSALSPWWVAALTTFVLASGLLAVRQQRIRRAESA
jgi:hypothetical protein